MAKVKVLVVGGLSKSVSLNPDATVGSTLGVDFKLPDGTVATTASLAALLGVNTAATTTAHRLLAGLTLGDDHPQYTRKDTLTTRGDLYAQGASTVGRLALGTASQFLQSNGTDPGWQTISPVITLGTDLSGSATLTNLTNATLNGTIVANAVTDSKLRQSAALSVIGRSANSTGNVADISAAADGDVLRRSGATLGFGNIGANPSASVGLTAVSGTANTYLRSDAAPALSQAITPTWTNTHTFNNTPVVPNASWTYAKIQNVSATSRILGRITAGAGSIEELTGTQVTTLLDAFTSGLKGLAPASGGGTTNFLRADGSWAAPTGTGGTVTSVAFSDASTSAIYSVSGSPVTTSGTLTITLATQAANKIFAGPTTGSAAQPTFRSLVAADIPALGGNPSASIGLTAVNGTANTYLRSDAAPALDVSISPTWSGTHTFSNTPVVPNASWTYAKIQNVSATSRILGRITAGAGSTEELTGTQATTLLDTFTSSLKGLAPASGGGTTNFLRADGSWAVPPGGSGTVTSVAFSDASTTAIYSVSGSPVTTSGTLTITLATQSANRVFAGPTTGAAAQPTFRALVAADIPALGANPSASIGLTAVNGSATTYMRSDAAPAISQSISPTWSGIHTFTAQVVGQHGTGSGLASFMASSTSPGYQWKATGADTDTKTWRQYANTTNMNFGVLNDDASIEHLWLTVARSGVAVGSLTWGNTSDNPTYAFTGTGAASFGGNVAATGTVSGSNLSSAGGANPSASIGLTAVNGSATTYMRSDAAPAISQSISPTWTGNHAWVQSSNSTVIPVALQNTSTGATARTDLRLQNSANISVLGITGTGFTGSVWTGGSTGTQQFLGTFASVPLTLGTNTTERITIAATGAVTIQAPTSGTGLTINGSSSSTPALNVASGTIQIGGSAGTSGQVLTSQGSGAAPSWTSVPTTYSASKPSATTRNTTTTVTADPDLAFSLPIGKYAIDCFIYFKASSTSGMGLKFDFLCSGGTIDTSISYYACNGNVNSVATTINNVTAMGTDNSFSTIGTGVGDWLRFVGFVNITAAGTFSFAWAQNSSSANNLSIFGGSWLKASLIV